MYEDTILPVRTKFRVPSRSQARVYFVQEKTKESLFFIKWIELVLCLLCLCFVIVTINTTEIPKVNKILVVFANSSSIVIVLAEITYPHLKRSFPLIVQVVCSGTNLIIFSTATILIYRISSSHDLIKTLLFLNGAAAIIFLVDFICRMLISTYLYETTRVRSVVDVAVSAIFPSSSERNKPKPHRSILTTPITYGGTFPIGKNQPPFLPDERIPPNDGCQTPEKGTRSRTAQTQVFVEGRGFGNSNFYMGTYYDKVAKSKSVQTYLEHDEIGTLTLPPLYAEEERRRKSPWTCSSPTTTKKIEARKQASMSTPITYSGTFAVNKEIVPFTPGTTSAASPKTSPRNAFSQDKQAKRNASSKSEGNSPVRSENIFLDFERLDQISEEKISQLSSENSSIKRSNCAFFDSSVLPGSVLEERDQCYRKNMNYFIT